MCDCIDTTNKLLAEHNAVLVTNLFGVPRICIEAEKIDSKQRRKPPKLQAPFCPFCGERYPERTSAAKQLAGVEA